MSKQTVEYRIFKSECRAKGDDSKPQIAGYAAVFNTPTDLGWMREKIAPGAFTKAIADKQDVKCLFNHDPNKVLGRTKSGTLELKEDNTGLHYTCDINPKTSIGPEVHAHVMRGDIDQCSFGFIVREEDVAYDDDGMATRTIKRADLFDVSPVTYPAYPTTSVEARSNTAALARFKRDAEDGDATNDHDDPPANKDKDVERDSCPCRCRACYSGECEEHDMHMTEDMDCMRCHMRSADVLKEVRAKKTKKVAGEELPSSSFLYVGDPNDTSTWSLPWKFSSEEKTKSHLRNALARFNQTKKIPASEKPAVYKKLVAKCKEYGIQVEGEEKSAQQSLELAKVRTRQLQIEASL